MYNVSYLPYAGTVPESEVSLAELPVCILDAASEPVVLSGARCCWSNHSGSCHLPLLGDVVVGADGGVATSLDATAVGDGVERGEAAGDSWWNNSGSRVDSLGFSLSSDIRSSGSCIRKVEGWARGEGTRCGARRAASSYISGE